MAARLWTALLVLAAVFAMHGVYCATAEAGPGRATTMTASAPGHAHAIASAEMTLADPITADPITAAPMTARPDSAPGMPHDATAHLWTVCLAVLAAAVALLLATLVPRSVRLTAPALRSVRARLRSATPLRPPDLSALCLLRI